MRLQARSGRKKTTYSSLQNARTGELAGNSAQTRRVPGKFGGGEKNLAQPPFLLREPTIGVSASCLTATQRTMNSSSWMRQGEWIHGAGFPASPAAYIQRKRRRTTGASASPAAGSAEHHSFWATNPRGGLFVSRGKETSNLPRQLGRIAWEKRSKIYIRCSQSSSQSKETRAKPPAKPRFCGVTSFRGFSKRNLHPARLIRSKGIVVILSDSADGGNCRQQFVHSTGSSQSASLSHRSPFLENKFTKGSFRTQ